MNLRTHAKRVEELYNSFKRVYSADADEAVMKRCFEQIVGVHEKRKFPDLTFLEHSLEAVNQVQGTTVWSRPLSCALWYQYRARRYLNVERSVAIARRQLAMLKVSKKDIESAVTLIRGITVGDPQGYDALILADANNYALYGVSSSRTNEIVAFKAEQEKRTYEYVQHVTAKQLAGLLSGKIYYSGMAKERFDVSTRQNIRDTLQNIKFIGSDNPNRRKLK